MTRFLFALMVFSSSASLAHACAAISVPTTIAQAGQYCVVSNIFVTQPDQNGIVVAANNVTIDMRGFSIVGPGSGRGVGVLAQGVSDFTLRDGQIWGFHYGVHVQPGNGAATLRTLIRGVDASDNLFRGITVIGSYSRIEYNRVKRIRGYAPWPSSHSFGIESTGQDCIIRFNQISDIVPYREGEGVGISVSGDGAGCQIYENVVKLGQPIYGRTLALWIGGPDDVASVHNNILIGATYGIFDKDGRAGAASGNYVRDVSDPHWILSSSYRYPGFFDRNDYARTGGVVTETVEYFQAKIAAEPIEPIWHIRLGTVVKERYGDYGAARQHYDDACLMGSAEGCRLRDQIDP